jgi:hypothetical protein
MTPAFLVFLLKTISSENDPTRKRSRRKTIPPENDLAGKRYLLKTISSENFLDAA